MLEGCRFEKFWLCLSMLLRKLSNCCVLTFDGLGTVGSSSASSILLDWYEAGEVVEDSD